MISKMVNIAELRATAVRPHLSIKEGQRITAAADEIERLRAALHTAGRNVYQGATSGGWIDHGPDCVAGIRELPCSCGLTDWLVEHQAELGIQLPPALQAETGLKP